MEQVLEPRYFGPPMRRLFGVYHPARAIPARAAVLMCPPLLHEQFRSYRFFSQVASELASGGIACFRFDYFGTGDSEGDDDRFSPAETRQDILLAAEELRRCSQDVPLILMGIRGSALFAYRDAQAVNASALWLWHPVTDGASYLEALQARDHAERNSRFRFPLLKGGAQAGPHDLMGFALSERFARELAACSINGGHGQVPITLLLDNGASAPLPVAGSRIVLPDSITAWASEIDLTSLIPLREARPIVERLLAGVAEGSVHG